MATTVQVSVKTKQMLDRLKEERCAKTYDQLINQLLVKHLRIPESMFGTVKGLRKWTKADGAGFHEW